MQRLLIAISLLFTATMLAPALAADPDEVMDDPVMEERAREISKGLRCVVCKNQSIDESDADLAKSLRLLVRERLEAGDTDEEVTAYVVDRYGEFVLLKPVGGSAHPGQCLIVEILRPVVPIPVAKLFKPLLTVGRNLDHR